MVVHFIAEVHGLRDGAPNLLVKFFLGTQRFPVLKQLHIAACDASALLTFVFLASRLVIQQRVVLAASNLDDVRSHAFDHRSGCGDYAHQPFDAMLQHGRRDDEVHLNEFVLLVDHRIEEVDDVPRVEIQNSAVGVRQLELLLRCINAQLGTQHVLIDNRTSDRSFHGLIDWLRWRSNFTYVQVRSHAPLKN